MFLSFTQQARSGIRIPCGGPGIAAFHPAFSGFLGGNRAGQGLGGRVILVGGFATRGSGAFSEILLLGGLRAGGRAAFKFFGDLFLLCRKLPEFGGQVVRGVAPTQRVQQFGQGRQCRLLAINRLVAAIIGGEVAAGLAQAIARGFFAHQVLRFHPGGSFFGQQTPLDVQRLFRQFTLARSQILLQRLAGRIQRFSQKCLHKATRLGGDGGFTGDQTRQQPRQVALLQDRPQQTFSFGQRDISGLARRFGSGGGFGKFRHGRFTDDHVRLGARNNALGSQTILRPAAQHLHQQFVGFGGGLRRRTQMTFAGGGVLRRGEIIPGLRHALFGFTQQAV